MLSKANKMQATTTKTLWAHLKFKYYHLQKGCFPSKVFYRGLRLQLL